MTNEEIKAADAVRIPIGITLDISYDGGTRFWCSFDYDHELTDSYPEGGFNFYGYEYDFATGELTDWAHRQEAGAGVARYLRIANEDEPEMMEDVLVYRLTANDEDFTLEREGEETLDMWGDADPEGAEAIDGTVTAEFFIQLTQAVRDKLLELDKAS